MAEPRDRKTRTVGTLVKLATPAIDVWVATASTTGAPHLVPLSMAWVEERIVLTVEGSSVTARNLTASGVARLGVGPTRDVVMIDALLEKTIDVAAGEALAAAYVAQADWDPRHDTGYVFLILRPIRIQAWREANELAGRTLMRDGIWLTEQGEDETP